MWDLESRGPTLLAFKASSMVNKTFLTAPIHVHHLKHYSTLLCCSSAEIDAICNASSSSSRKTPCTTSSAFSQQSTSRARKKSREPLAKRSRLG